MKTFLHIVGTRPNFIKAAPLVKELMNYEVEQQVIHTGQHFDPEMSELILKDLNFPDIIQYLNAKTFSEILVKLYGLVNIPDYVIVYGDVDSTLAGALWANKHNIKLIHVESGLRSHDKTMPEEINRRLVDQITDIAFCSCTDAMCNLACEEFKGVKYLVGNLMIDSLKQIEDKLISIEMEEDYYVATFHRPSNVDTRKKLRNILNLFKKLDNECIVFFMHPRTRKSIESFGMMKEFLGVKNLRVVDSFSYISFISHLKNSKGIITDSGGIQEEASYLDIPCYTLRENTERPVTLRKNCGTNVLINNGKELLIEIENNKSRKFNTCIEKWDGKTARRICNVLMEEINYYA